MADPRLAPKFEEIGFEAVTFKADGVTITYDAGKRGGSAAVEGTTDAVTSSGNQTVALADTGNAITGKLLRVNADGSCVVQIAGTMTFRQGNGALTTVGKKIVGAQGPAAAKGYIKEIADAVAAPTQAEFNNALKARGLILDQSDVNAVVVLLP